MKRTLLTLVLVLSAFAAANAQGATTGAFAGNVVNAKSDKPLKGAAVEFTNVRTGHKYRRVTDADGGFYVGRLEAGIYRIEISAPGFKTRFVEQRLLVSQVNTVLPVPTTLEPEDAVPTAPRRGKSRKTKAPPKPAATPSA